MGERRGMKALELWCKRVTDGYQGVRVENMSTSWRDGLAFCAIIHHFRPDLIDFASLKKSDILHNNELAFRTAEVHLGIPALLDAEDMVEFLVPDRLSILTYLSQFYQAFASGRQSTSPMHNRTPPGGKRPASPSVLSPSSQTPTKVAALGPARREPCAKCGNPVFIAERLLVGRRLFHRACFRCARCSNQLSLANYYETEDGAFCCEACPDEVDGKAAQESRDEYSQDCEDVLDRDPLLAARDIIVTEAKQDVAMSNFMIGQLQWEEKEVSLPLPPSIVKGQDTDNQGQHNTLDTEISRDTSAPVSLASDTSSKAEGVDISNEQSLYFCTKTNSSAAENDSFGPEEVPAGVSRSRVKNFSDSIDYQPSTATNKTEDCINDQNELTTKRTKDLDDKPNSIVKMRMKMFDVDQQKENAPRKKYSSRTSITLSRTEEDNIASDNLSPDLVKATKMEDEKQSESIILITEGVDSEVTASDSNEMKERELVAQKDQDLNFVTGSVSDVDVGMSKVENVDNLGQVEMSQELIPIDVENVEKINMAAIISDPVLPSIVVHTASSESQEDDALPNSQVEPVADTETLASVDIPVSVSMEVTKESDLPFESRISEQETKDEEQPESTSKRVSMKDDLVVYPTELNPFGDDDSDGEPSTFGGNPFGEEEEPPPLPKSKPPRPPPPRVLAKPAEEGGVKVSTKPAEEGKSKPSANPFWSDGEEPESEEEVTAVANMPVPLPRSILKVAVPEPSPAPRLSLDSGGKFGSSNSLSSTDSSANSTLHRRKKAAPPPPPADDATVTTTLPRHRKARPAPPPPGQTTPPRRLIPATECDKSEKELANRSRQSKEASEPEEQSAFALAANKSMYGQWKRKKGPAPPRPVPQRRQIREIPMKEVKRELQDIEVRQLELERQGVSLEKTIREKFDDTEPVLDVEDSTGSIIPDVEDKVMLLFEIVNEKNELFRRQAELMYLRRQHRLEEEHADLEYEIRVSLERPEHTKTDSEKAYEEELIRRLVDIVERRDEIVNCLEMDRQREAEEDRSIHHQLATFAAKYKGGEDPNATFSPETDSKAEKNSSPKKSSTLKMLKKKVIKSKKKEVSGTDADKDVDELETSKEKRNSKERTEKSPRKKWF